MRKTFLIVIVIIACAGASSAQSQTTQKSLSATMNVYVFPTEGQTSQQQATAEQIENFKKAFSVCLEAKKYMVKY